MRRDALVAGLLLIDGSEIMEELFWSLSEKYSSDEKVYSWSERSDVGEISDRAKLEFDWDLPNRRAIYLGLAVRKQMTQATSDTETERMYVVTAKLGERGSQRAPFLSPTVN
jgi:hypothetical protein